MTDAALIDLAGRAPLPALERLARSLGVSLDGRAASGPLWHHVLVRLVAWRIYWGTSAELPTVDEVMREVQAELASRMRARRMKGRRA